jgi:hypothetical protein
MNQGIVPKFYDRNEAIKLDKKYQIIPKNDFLNCRKKFFIVVTPENGRNEIIDELQSYGYNEGADYCTLPCTTRLFSVFHV